jgi:hypothetical protein
MRKDDQSTVQASKFLQVAYRRLKSWSKVAKRYGLSNKARAFKIAHGTLRVNAKCDSKLLEEMEMLRTKNFRRFIRKVAVPFLEAHQQSPTHMYLRGGKPWKGW